jgi:hypothetical protein
MSKRMYWDRAAHLLAAQERAGVGERRSRDKINLSNAHP